MFGMDDARGRRFPMAGCVPGIAAHTGQVQQGEYSSALLGYSEGEKAVCPQQLQVLSVPIMGFGGKVIGVLQAAKRVESPQFSEEDQYILEVWQSQACCFDVIHCSPFKLLLHRSQRLTHPVNRLSDRLFCVFVYVCMYACISVCPYKRLCRGCKRGLPVPLRCCRCCFG